MNPPLEVLCDVSVKLQSPSLPPGSADLDFVVVQMANLDAAAHNLFIVFLQRRLWFEITSLLPPTQRALPSFRLSLLRSKQTVRTPTVHASHKTPELASYSLLTVEVFWLRYSES